jgi:lipopolysaccharide/colanic/teichoic acid biosynthesis glycosyltransferase
VYRTAAVKDENFARSPYAPSNDDYGAWGSSNGDRLHVGSEKLIRALDIALAAAILLFIAPLLVVVALLVKFQDGGPIFFAHKRIGRGGREFKCLKFRSMLVDSEARLQHMLATDEVARQEWHATQKLRKDPRITPLGAFLRRSSLDELPQFINVLRGEMSVVGPRPIVQAEVKRYGRRFRHYTAVRPGITGLWQVGGRSDVSYRRRVAFDVMYARQRSPTLYLAIVLRTVPAVLAREGSY